jgi:hypothetical protein
VEAAIEISNILLLLKRGEQPVGLHAARQGRLRVPSKDGDLESATLTSIKISPESRRFWPRFPLCADPVTVGPIPGQLSAPVGSLSEPTSPVHIRASSTQLHWRAAHLSAGLGQTDVHFAQLHSRRAGIGEGDRYR